MIFDIKMVFFDKKDAAQEATSAGIDCGSDYLNPVDSGHKMALCVSASGLEGTSLAFRLEDSADNSAFTAVATSKAFTAEELAEPIVVSLPFEHRRYLRLVTVPTSVTAGTITAWLGNDYKFGHLKEEEGWEFHSEAAAEVSTAEVQ